MITCIFVALLGAGTPPAEIQGAWYMHDSVVDGTRQFTEIVSGTNPDMTIHGEQLILHGQIVAGRVTVDDKARPRTIDVTYDVAPIGGKTELGIWKCEDGALTICSATVGNPRPTAFTADKDSHHRLCVYKRHPSLHKGPVAGNGRTGNLSKPTVRRFGRSDRSAQR
jgi:uncharacterized protein (TIGR03067 family)